jgi:triacylglycerol lipase
MMAAATWALLAGAFFGASAQVPAEIAAQNHALGQRIDVPSAIRTYAGLEQQPPYPAAEAKIIRNVAYGDDPRYRLDIFAPSKRSRRLRPVVIFATGGDFTRRINLPGGAPFYDNVVLWIARQGLVGVNTDRRPLRGASWQTGPEDMRAIIGWVHRHISEYGGDPDRVIFLGHAYGSTQLISYLAHPQYWCCNGPGIIGATVISAPLNLQPATPPPVPAPGGAGGANGTTPDRAQTSPAQAGITGRGRRVTGPNPLFDPQHSDLPGLARITIPIFIGAAQLEGAQQRQSEQVLQQRLCGLGNCPVFRQFQDHNHLSVMFSFNTADRSVSGPVLAWIRGISSGSDPHKTP